VQSCTILYIATQYCFVQQSFVQYSAVLYWTVQPYTVIYSVGLYCTLYTKLVLLPQHETTLSKDVKDCSSNRGLLQYSSQYIVHSTHSAVYSVHCTLYSVQCTLHSRQFTVHSTHYRVLTVQLNSAQSTVNCTVMSPHQPLMMKLKDCYQILLYTKILRF